MEKFLIWNLPLWAMIPAIIAKLLIIINNMSAVHMA